MYGIFYGIYIFFGVTSFKMIKQGLHDERLTRSCSCIRAEKAVQVRVLGLA